MSFIIIVLSQRFMVVLDIGNLAAGLQPSKNLTAAVGRDKACNQDAGTPSRCSICKSSIQAPARQSPRQSGLHLGAVLPPRREFDAAQESFSAGGEIARWNENARRL
jgi:hypothetical protein